MGDTPYSAAEAQRLDRLIEDLNAEPLAFVVHVGDINGGSAPCSDSWLEARKRQFGAIRHPFVLLPGDNEWTDCHRTGFDPMERLAKWRALFCGATRGLALEVQPGEYCEHVRWRHDGMLFVALNIQGSNNNLGRTPEMDAEHGRRTRAALDWLAEAAALAASGRAVRLVVLMQGNPFEVPARGPDGFSAVREALAAHASRLDGRLVLVHGDSHVFKDDEPLPKLRRIEVWGSPMVSYLRAARVGDSLRAGPAGRHY